MMQALNALIGAALVIAACFSCGALLADSLRVPLLRYERFPLCFVLGAACLHLAIFLVLALHVAYWPAVIALPVGSILLAWRKGALRLGEKVPPVAQPLRILWTSIFAIFTVLYFFNALAPESSPDGSGYHLGLVDRYMRAHGFPFISTNMYASLSQGVELLFLPAYIIGRHSAGALVHYGFLIAVTLAIFAFGRRLGFPWVGGAASLLFYLSPVVGIDGTAAYIDVGVAAIVFVCFYFLWLWDESQDMRLLVPAGLLAGYSYAAKYTAFTILPFALLWVLLRSRKLKPVLVIGALSLVMVAPWMLKDSILMGNPMAPFLNQYFRNPYVHVDFEKGYSEFLTHYTVENRWTLPLEVTVRGFRTTGLIGPVFLLLPLALLTLRTRAGRALLAAGLFVLAPYFLNVGTRFLIPSLPFFSLAICLAMETFPVLLASLMVFHALASWPSGVKLYAHPYAWRLNNIPYKAALRVMPPDKYLRQVSSSYGLAKMVEFYVPKGERVLGINGMAESYSTRDYLVSFQAGFNESLTDTFNMGWIPDHQPSVLKALRFPPTMARKVRFTLTGPGRPKDQWSIHEIRFFSGGKEIPRDPQWRLTAFPNPWEIQFAFDNSPATRWRTWEPAAAGMFIQVDFPSPLAVDEIHIETSPDVTSLKIRTGVAGSSGDFQKVGDDYESSRVPVKANIRRAATWEMHLRGVNYFLIGDGDWGAEDVRDDPEGWGLRQIAAGYGARLYQVLPLETK